MKLPRRVLLISNSTVHGRGYLDHEILGHEFVVYDALYAECKRRVPQT